MLLDSRKEVVPSLRTVTDPDEHYRANWATDKFLSPTPPERLSGFSKTGPQPSVIQGRRSQSDDDGCGDDDPALARLRRGRGKGRRRPRAVPGDCQLWTSRRAEAGWDDVLVEAGDPPPILDADRLVAPRHQPRVLGESVAEGLEHTAGYRPEIQRARWR